MYQVCRRAIIGLVSNLDPDELGTSVPGCPEWTVKDLIGHLSGIAADFGSGHFEGYSTDEWTAAQVEARRDHSLENILREWAENCGVFEKMLDDPESSGAPEIVAILATIDIATHEQDLRGTIARVGGRDEDVVAYAVAMNIGDLRARATAAGLPSFSVQATDHREWAIGKGQSVARVSAPLYELFRMFNGRRSRAQAVGLDWSGGPDPFVDQLVNPFYSWRAEPLVE
jgi:uncharacterized protein (TIGR03083 family)